jgi:sugar-phosphatase
MRTRFPAEGLLFDCDGVLVDSDASVISAWTRWARRYDLEPEEIVALVHGRRSIDTVSMVIPERHRTEALRLIDRYEIEDAATVRALPGADELLGALPGSAWAIVTSALAPLARARLAAAGLPEPQVLITADLVAEGKPAPEGLATVVLGIGKSQYLLCSIVVI